MRDSTAICGRARNAQDLFTGFAGVSLERTYDPDTEVRRFLGRPMKPDAFYRQCGITP